MRVRVRVRVELGGKAVGQQLWVMAHRMAATELQGSRGGAMHIYDARILVCVCVCGHVCMCVWGFV